MASFVWVVIILSWFISWSWHSCRCSYSSHNLKEHSCCLIILTRSYGNVVLICPRKGFLLSLVHGTQSLQDLTWLHSAQPQDKHYVLKHLIVKLKVCLFLLILLKRFNCYLEDVILI